MNIATLGPKGQDVVVLAQACRHASGQEIKEFSSNVSILHEVKGGNKFDLIFVDIDTSDSGGIPTIIKLAQYQPSTLIVAISQHNLGLNNIVEYIWKFIIKPISVAEIKSIIVKAQQLLAAQLIYLPTNGTRDRIALNIHNIVYFEMFNKDGVVHTADKQKYSFRSTLTVVENSLEPALFFKPHKSYLVNIKYIQYISEHEIRVINGDVIPLSRNRRKQVYKLLSTHPEIVFT